MQSGTIMQFRDVVGRCGSAADVVASGGAATRTVPDGR